MWRFLHTKASFLFFFPFNISALSRRISDTQRIGGYGWRYFDTSGSTPFVYSVILFNMTWYALVDLGYGGALSDGDDKDST